MGKHIILERLGTILTPIKHLLDKLEANKVDRSELGEFNEALNEFSEVLDSKINKEELNDAVANLVNSAPATLDTLGELATALQENEDVVETLNKTVANKVSKTELTNAVDVKMNKSNPSGSGNFSLNRKNSSTVGNFSAAIGYGTTASGQYSLAVGKDTVASSEYSYAEGYLSSASNWAAHAEGWSTYAIGQASHAEGGVTRASGNRSHAEGSSSEATGDTSHAEGLETIAAGQIQHVQGKYNIEDSTSTYAHIVGNGTYDTARSNAHTLDWDGNAWFAGDVYVGSTSGTNEDEGSKKLATEEYVATKKDKDLIVSRVSSTSTTITHTVNEIAEAVENGQTVKFLENVEFFNLLEVNKDYGYATFFMLYVNQQEKLQSQVITIVDNEIVDDIDNTYDFALKTDALLKAQQTLTDAELTQVRSNLKFIGEDLEGKTFTIDGQTYTASPNAERFGDYINNIAIGQWSIAEGSGTIAKGRASHAEGAYSQALQDGSHVEGYQTKATGYWSHAEGEMTTVSSYASHAEGSYCTLPNGTKRYGTASGYASHVEGGGCHTTGSCSHAEGLATTASGAQSHVEGRYTIAAGGAQHVEGIANIEDAEGKYIHIAGNGSFDDRSNAYTLDWNGTAWFSGDVYVGSASGKNKDEGSQKLITSSDLRGAKLELEDYVNNELSHKGVIRKEGTIVQHDCVKNMGISVISYIPAGTTNISLLHCGKNICPGVVMGAAYMTKTGIFNTSQPNYTSTEKFPVFAGVQYIDSTNNNTAINRKTFHYWDVDGNWLGVRLGNEGYTINDRIEGAVMMAVTYYNPDATQIAQWAQVEIGTVATDYEEYKGEEFSCDFGGAISGGEFNWNTGILTIADDDMTQMQFESHNILSFEGVNTIASANGSHVVDFNRDVYRVTDYVTKDYVDELKDQLTIDDTVLADSENAVSGAAVAAYVADHTDQTVTATSTDAVSGKAVADYVAAQIGAIVNYEEVGF